MLAKEIMHKSVVSVNPQMTLREVTDLFANHEISGAPVVSAEGGLIGVISKTDLVSQTERNPDIPNRRRGPAERRVEQAMTPWCVSMEDDTPVPELARQMAAKKIHRIVITHDGKICGIVTSLDIVRALLKMLDQTMP